jgi:hypothetical protein
MSDTKKLYVVHVGFYDKEPNFGVYEAHTNFFVIASSPRAAKQAVKAKPVYKKKKMHTDGVQEIIAVDGCQIKFAKDAKLKGGNIVNSYSYNELNPAAPIGATN